MECILSFSLLLLVHLSCRWMKLVLRKKKKSVAEQQLAAEIKDILHQANSLTTPSTFAKAAKLQRIAAAKEKELLQLRRSQWKSQLWLVSWQSLLPEALKAFTYLVLIYWFWQHPVSIISSELIYPFDRVLTWKSQGFKNAGFVEIGIFPWLFICTKVCVFLTKSMKLN